MPKEFSSLVDPFHTIEISDPVYEHERLRVVSVKSRALGRRGDVSLWIPEAASVDTLLILLHGVYGSHWVWSLKGGAHRTATRLVDAGEIKPMVIAMPSDGLKRDGSGYLNWPGGEDVDRWIVEEVPVIARIAAPALLPNANIAIAGLSMGGYGALRLGAKYADGFCAVSAHSAVTNLADLSCFVEEPASDYRICGNEEELSVAYWLRKHRSRLSPIRFDCGVDDPLLPSNRALHADLLDQRIVHSYTEFPGGHEWNYWTDHFADTLRFVNRHSQPKDDV
jgi:putative tributyrin esterase